MAVKKALQSVIVTAFILSLFSATMAAKAPTEAIKSTVDSILNTMRDKSLSAPEKKQERRDKISSFLRDGFNFIEMSKRSLAKHWKKISVEEKKEFVSVFSDLLEASYIGKIEQYTDEKITYDKEKIKGKGKYAIKIKGKGKYAIINTTIVTKSVDIPIDYRLIMKKDKWWVYDVVIEGVSFVSTYRSQYNKIIIKESFPKLLESMRNKLKEVRELEKKGTE
jgi:phospholipid transport system substrate-binding protein